MPESAAPGYTLTARVLHWVTAALVLTMIPIGIAMANADFGRLAGHALPPASLDRRRAAAARARSG